MNNDQSAARQLHVSPHLAVLVNIPFALPFLSRAKLFSDLIAQDKASPLIAGLGWGLNITIRRRCPLFSALDGFISLSSNNDPNTIAQLSASFSRSLTEKPLSPSEMAGIMRNKAARMRGTIRLTYVDKHGNREAGIDGGGLFKDVCAPCAMFNVCYSSCFVNST